MKLVRTAIFAGIAASVLYVFASGLHGRTTPQAGAAILVVIGDAPRGRAASPDTVYHW